MLYDILKEVAEKTTPERMGKESRKILSEIQALTINYLTLYYMEGRMGAIFRDGGDPKSENEEKIKQTIFILDFWERLSSSYFQNGKHFVADINELNEQGGAANIALDQTDIDWSGGVGL